MEQERKLYMFSMKKSYIENYEDIVNALKRMEGVWIAQNAERIGKLIKSVCEDRVLSKYICDYTWISGSSTQVWPIEIWWEGKCSIRLEGGRKMHNYRLRGVIRRIKDKFGDIVYDCHSDSEFYDSSCPVEFSLIFKNNFLAKLKNRKRN